MKPRRDSGGMTLASPIKSDGTPGQFMDVHPEYSRRLGSPLHAQNNTKGKCWIGGGPSRICLGTGCGKGAIALRRPSDYLEFKRRFEKQQG